jgi:predicted patatin/cPLA2 family phospholipase
MSIPCVLSKRTIGDRGLGARDMGERYWSPEHPVLDVLQARRERGDRSDPYRVGLAIQGGGMRGVISAAMLTALEDLGLHHAFDAIYGTSSGALNGAYFLGGTSWKPLQIYWDHLATRQFIDLRRFFNGDVLNLDYAFETVLTQLEPLDHDAVLDSKVPLHVALTLVDELRTEVVSHFESRADLTDALRASSWLPVAVRGTTTFRGKRAIDGAVLTVHPHRYALADGCTHVLSLSTRSLAKPGGELPLSRLYWGWRLDRIKPGLAKGHQQAKRDYRQDRIALRQRSRHPDQPPYVLDLGLLPGMRAIPAFETDPGRLMLAARWAYEVMVCAAEGRYPDPASSADLRTSVRFLPSKGEDG